MTRENWRRARMEDSVGRWFFFFLYSLDLDVFFSSWMLRVVGAGSVT